MTGNKECKIIQDLLPNYIEKMTSKITNDYVEKHINNCEECKEVFNNMNKRVELNVNKNNNKDINYLKKFKDRMTLLKTILLVVGTIVIIFIGNIGYKYNILSKIYDRNVEYDIGNNYRITSLLGDGNETVFYYKDGVGKMVTPQGHCIWTNENEAYMVIQNEKKYMPLEKGVPGTVISNKLTLGTYGLMNVEKKSDLLSAVMQGATIKTEEYRGRKHYVIRINGEKLWIDKETFFITRDDYEGQTTEFIVETNCVTENDIVKPNFTGYELLN